MALIIGTVSSSVQKAAGAFESIASATGTGSSNTITFSSIPSTYQHLQLRIHGFTSTATGVSMRLNNDTGSNYAWHNLNGYNGTASAYGVTSTPRLLSFTQQISAGSTYSTVSIVDVHDYASTSKYKTARVFSGCEANSAVNSEINLFSGLWMSTTAVNRIDVYIPGAGNFTTNTTIALYGIKGA